MNGGPQTTREAAIRAILGEMGPLLDRAETAANTLHQAHELIEKDLGNLGQLVTKVEETISNTMDHITYLQDQFKSIKVPAMPAPAQAAAKAVPSIDKKLIIGAMIGCSILSAVLAAGAVAMFNMTTIEDARIGRAVSRALPYIDASTKKKLEDAIQKAGS